MCVYKYKYIYMPCTIWASQVLLKNLPVNAGDIGDVGSSPGFEDPMAEGIATHSNILAWRISWTKESWVHGLWGCKELDMTEGAKHAHVPIIHTSWSVKSNGPLVASL